MRHGSILIYQRNDFLQSPNVIGNTCFHCRCNSQRLVDAAEIVVEKMDAVPLEQLGSGLDIRQFG